MTKTILALALLAMIATVVVLGRGIGTLGKTGADNSRLSNRMMRWRVGLQFVAVVLIVAAVWFAVPA